MKIPRDEGQYHEALLATFFFGVSIGVIFSMIVIGLWLP